MPGDFGHALVLSLHRGRVRGPTAVLCTSAYVRYALLQDEAYKSRYAFRPIHSTIISARYALCTMRARAIQCRAAPLAKQSLNPPPSHRLLLGLLRWQEEDPGTQASAELIPGMIERQAAAAVREADAVIAVMDGQAGPCASDQDILDWMRRKHPNTPVVLAVRNRPNPGSVPNPAQQREGGDPP